MKEKISSMRPKNKKPQHKEKPRLHKRNKHTGRYDFEKLIASCPGLSQFVELNKFGTESIDFFNPEAVKMLNKALLINQYGIEFWDIPEGYLCPPIPGRADYIHHLADLASAKNFGRIPKGKTIKVLDIGTGANCIYPIIGHSAYGWSFIGSDIDETAIKSAGQIVKLNTSLKGAIELRLQNNPKDFFYGVLDKEEQVDFTVCNPPFHGSLEEAQEGSARKVSNLTHKKVEKPTLNFGGQSNELWVEGGEERFVKNMVRESKKFAANCFWFTTLVSKSGNLKSIETALEKIDAVDVKVVPMGQGNKTSRLVAWTFLTIKEQQEWSKKKWNSK